MDKTTFQLELKNNSDKKYKIEAMYNSAVYAKKLKSGHLLGLYYLVL